MAMGFYDTGKSKIFQKWMVKTSLFSNFFHGTFPVLDDVIEAASFQINIYFQLESLQNKEKFYT